MQTITTFLTFASKAEEAVALYTETIPGSKIKSTTKGPGGAVMSLEFELAGQTFYALNGGPSFAFAAGFSLFVSCDTQDEIDRTWAKLVEGGKEVQCGWLVDRFGVSWQVVPRDLGRWLGNADREKAGRAMQAMMKMVKLDMAALERAFEGR